MSAVERDILDDAVDPRAEHEAKDERDVSRPPPPPALIATEAELEAATLAPRCIVRGHTYADVAQVVAPGGTGKTTILIREAVHMAVGMDLWGLKVESPGWTLYVSAEDQRPRLLARLREILRAMDLSTEDRAKAIAGFRVWDVAGHSVKLITIRDSNMTLTALADDIVEAYQNDPPAVVVFDPLVSFGASEQAVNDNEQALVTAARRIVRGLDCCVRFVHHTGKGNAREATLDQYSGRGGSALTDGTRMTTVMQAWSPDAQGALTPPPGCTADNGSTVTIMARPKLSYEPPLPLVWIRRTGYDFEYFTDPPKQTPAAIASAQADQVERYLISQIAAKRYHTQRTLEESTDTIGIPRAGIRRALSELRVSNRLVDADLPQHLRQGSRKTYLKPVSNCADDDGAVEQKKPAQSSHEPPPPTTAPPYREWRSGAVESAHAHTSFPELRREQSAQYGEVGAVEESASKTAALDGRVVSHSFGPPATADQVQAWYPDAKSIEADEQPAIPKPHREHGRTKKNPGMEWRHQHWRIIPQDASKPEFVRDFGYPVSMSHVRNLYPDAMITAVTEQEASQ